MGFNARKFKKNIGFLILCVLLIVLLIVFSMWSDNKNSLPSKDLDDKDVSIGKLVINEIMSSNKGVIADEEGNLYDYLELYNGNDHDINLKDYGLSDENTKVKYVFPDTVIEAHGYIVVYLSGKNKEGLYTNFKLKSAGGETVALLKPNGKVVDAIETVSLDSNTVMARDTEGAWVVQDKPTPGFSNNVEGYNKFLKSLESSESKKIVINEILAENKGNFKNENGEYSGYIEIKNISDESINIKNYSLSNNESVSFKWQLPNIKLSKGEVLLIYTSGVSSNSGTLSTGFKLKSKKGTVVLTNNSGKVIDKVKYENLANGMAYIREDDKYLMSNSISPGYDNTVDGIKSFQKKYLKVESSLIINEVMNNNYSCLPQNGGNYYDWIELYNNGKNDIKLSDYCLTTNINTVCMSKLPDVTLKKGEYYVVMASGNTELSNKSYTHLGFKLGDNDAIYLTKDSSIIDSMYVSQVPNGYSYGRGSSYGLYYFSKPTPKAKNNSGTEAISYLPTSSVEGGVIKDGKEFQVALTGKKIYYTLDGSTPTTSSKVYSSPLTIKKTTVLKIMSKEDGKLASDVNTYSYIMDGSHKVSVMSISIDKKKLNKVNSHTSLNSKVLEHGYVEYFDKDGGGFKINMGLKLFGGSTRSYKKKSYEIKFKKMFGDAKLKYKVFDTVDSSVFDSLVLRTGSQDEFQYNDQRTVIKDVVATSLMGEYGTADVQAYEPIILYINGSYNGIYFIREKVDETFVANHYNVQTTKHDTSILRIDGEVKSGSDSKYKAMINFINKNSLSNKNNYAKIKEQIDIKSLCDFWVGEIYTANYDILNTRYFSNKNVDNGKWKFIFYDLDSGFFRTTQNTFTEYTSASGMGDWNFPTDLLRNLMKSDEFKKEFLERLSYNLKNTWSYDNVNKRIDEVIAMIGKDEFKRNAERWGNSYSHWEKSISAMKTFAKKRNSYVIKYAKSYFKLSNSDVNKYFGGVK